MMQQALISTARHLDILMNGDLSVDISLVQFYSHRLEIGQVNEQQLMRDKLFFF